MPNTNIASIGQTGIQWYISDLSSIWDTASYQYAYIQINGSTSSAVYPPPAPGSGTTTGWGSFSGLTPNTTYTAYGYVVALNGSAYPCGSYTFTTAAAPPSSLTGLYVTATGDGYVSLTWNASANASYYNISWSGGSTSVSGTSATITGLTNGVSYTFTVTPMGPGGSGGSGYASGTPTAPAPTGTPNITLTASSGRIINASWYGVSGANNYKVYANNNNGSGDVLKYDGSSTSISFTVDSEYRTFTVKVIPYNSGTMGNYNTQTVTTLDETDPVADAFYVSGVHATSIDVVATGHDVTPSYSSNNGQSGVRGYWFYISYDGGNSWSFCKQIDTTGTGYYTYSNGVDGVSMSPNVTYTFGMRVVDNAGRASTMLTCTGKTQYARPVNWGWTTGNDVYSHKIPRGNYSMLASEWNSFTSRINDFLLYKAVVTTPYGFQNAYSGNDFLSTMFNEAANQINRMTQVYYTTKYRGDSVQADDLNYLMDRLNSIA